jgi:molybdopterin molybdotransferase
MIPIDEALDYILNHITRGPEALVRVRDALGLVLARDVRATSAIPPFTNSAMDGYAVRSADTRGAASHRPVTLGITEVVPAGTWPSKTVRAGTAAKIMTGAAMPRGADAVLIVEHAEERGNNVICRGAVAPGENVRRAGEDVRQGERILVRGKVIRPQEMGMLAAAGMTRVRVYARPRVAVLATGSELVAPHRIPGPGQVRNCNNLSLAGLLRKYGAAPVDLGIVRDEPRALQRKMLAASRYDMIIASGGVSVGEYDLARRVLARIGAAVKVWQVRVKPGKPLAFGLIRGKPFFGLPGNPVSVMVSFEYFVRPAILTMMGRVRLGKPHITAELEREITTSGDRVNLVRARVRRRAGRYYARATGPQGSGILASMVAADGLIVIPAGRTSVRAGEKVSVMMLDWSEEGAV